MGFCSLYLVNIVVVTFPVIVGIGVIIIGIIGIKKA